MKFASTRFGNLEVDDRTILTFPTGILGFPDWTKYVILDHDTDAPFKWLQCVEQADLAFVIIDPTVFKPDYCVHPGLDALTEIQATGEQDLIVAVLLTIPSADPTRITANLRGPLIMNPHSRLCKQIVLSEDCPTRYPLFTPQQPSAPALENVAV
ncbi:MAG TPA: flagellar assembly protein FliW [Nitrospiraceae bacterium]|nr:flagellar assembly protein FliW [Nitrospiraceae bacterium]